MDYLSKPMASIGFISVPVKSNTHLFKAVFWAIPKKGASGFYVWVYFVATKLLKTNSTFEKNHEQPLTSRSFLGASLAGAIDDC